MVFQVWPAAGGITWATSIGKVVTVISGQLRLAVQAAGTVDLVVIIPESNAATSTGESVRQFVAFGIKNGGCLKDTE